MTDADIASRLEAVEAHLARVTAEVADLSAALVPNAETGGMSSGPDAVVVEPVFPTLTDWVEQYYLPVFTRPIGGTIRWCDQWHAHPEATLRLEALWRSWETLRLDPNLGMTTWLTHYADHLVATLLASHGPFARCGPQRHS